MSALEKGDLSRETMGFNRDEFIVDRKGNQSYATSIRTCSPADGPAGCHRRRHRAYWCSGNAAPVAACAAFEAGHQPLVEVRAPELAPARHAAYA